MLPRRKLRELTSVGQHFRDESLAFGNPLDFDRDALHRALDAFESLGDVGGNRGRRRTPTFYAPRPRAHERKEHNAEHAEHDRGHHHVFGHGEFPREASGRGSAPASARSESSLVRKRWFSEMRSTSIATESIARSMRSIRSAFSCGT